MLDTDLDDPPADPEAFKRWREATKRQIEKEKSDIALERSDLARQPASSPRPFILPVLIALLTALVGYLALALHSSIETIDRRTFKIESALSGSPAAEPAAKPPAAETTAATDERLATALNAIRDQITATRVQVDAIRDSIIDLQKFASKAKDATPAGFASDEMLVAQKGLVVKATGSDGPGAGGTRTWLATPSHDTLDLLLKITQRTSSQVLAFAPKQENQVKSVDIYDRNTKTEAGKIADCKTDNKIMRCKLNVLGPTVLQVVVKTTGDEQFNIELMPGS